METFLRKKYVFIPAALICTLLWGTAFPAIKFGYAWFHIAADDVATKTLFAGIRFFGSGVITLLFYAIFERRRPQIGKRFGRDILLLGLVQTTLQYLLAYMGNAFASGVNASLLNGVGTFACIVIGRLVYRQERFPFAKWLGCIIGFAGVALNYVTPQGLAGFTLRGDLPLLLSALCAAVGLIYSKQAVRGESPLLLTGLQLAFGGGVLIVAGYAFGGRVHFTDARCYWLMLYMMLLSSVAFSIWTVLLKYNTAVKVTVYNFFIPLFGALFCSVFGMIGWLQNENPLDARLIASVALVCLGIYICNKVPSVTTNATDTTDTTDTAVPEEGSAAPKDEE